MNLNRSRFKMKFSEIFSITILAIISLFFLVEGVQDLDTVTRWDSTGIIEYSGNYNFCAKKHYRNTIYVFELSNGDTIYAPSEYLKPKSNLKDFDELTFRYASQKKIVPFGLYYSCVSVETIEGEPITIAIEKIKNEYILGIIVHFVLGVLSTILLLVLLLTPNIFVRIIRAIKRVRPIRGRFYD